MDRIVSRLGQTAGFGVRGIIGMALVVALLLQAVLPAFAQSTTGQISGTITSGQSGAPVAGAQITAAAPSGTYNARTDARGFFTLIGLSPDTYTVTIKATGFQAQVQNGVTVNAGLVTTVSLGLSGALQQIGRVSARSQNGAFQPTQPIDTYSVNPQQIDTILGKEKATSETNLLIALPGASLDSSGYPVLRGGRENEEGFQFEGIDYTDAFTTQFVNSLSLNGEQNFQLTPGAGDASSGNAGTGTINITLKRGARPDFGSLDLEASNPRFGHQFSSDFGFATPDGRFSDYISFVGQREGNEYDNRTADLVQIGASISRQYFTNNDLVNNLIFKFGKDNNQQLQFVYQNQQDNFYYQGAPGTQFGFRNQDPIEQYYAYAYAGLPPSITSKLIGFAPDQTSASGSFGNLKPEAIYQPNETYKLQYSNNLNASTFFTIKYYRVGSVSTFDEPYPGAGSFYAGDVDAIQGGSRNGASFDLTDQINAKNLITLGAKYDFLHPVDSFYSATTGFFNTVFSNGGEFLDFIPAAQGGTGYLSPYFPGGIPAIPAYSQSPQANRQDHAFYINDAYSPTDRLKINLGLRIDGTNYQLPSVTSGAYNVPGGYGSAYYLPVQTGVYAPGTIVNGVNVGGMPNPAADVYNTGGNSTKSPSVLEPRAAFSFQATKADAVRFSYGRSTEFTPIADTDARIPTSLYAGFTGIPATAMVCGTTGDRLCKNYGDQLFWENQNNGAGVPIQPAKPETFNNYDASYSHDFGHGFSMKATPFYRRGYDAVALVASQKVTNGVPQFDPVSGAPLLNPAVTTNLGQERTTGAELYVTKEAAYGFSGQLSLTYLNEFSNVIPTSVNEDFFPSIPPASLALGNLYRVGFVSPFNGALAVAYRTRSGFKINPIVYFNHGYPIGTGNITQTIINGGAYNVPQTNVTNQSATGGSTGATNYVDPQNPGNQFHPNIAATRGTPEGASPGTYLSASRATANLDFEWSPPHSRSTFGVLISNLFNNVYSQPSLNGRYQPVADGISGPKTGTTSLANATALPQAPGVAYYGANYGFVNYAAYRYGNDPYVLSPNGTPISYRFYYQLSF